MAINRFLHTWQRRTYAPHSKSAKAPPTPRRAIEEALGIWPYDPEWTLPSLLENNALVWMAEVNGLLVDLRTMPREVQEAAFAKGMIPYIPANRPDRS